MKTIKITDIKYPKRLKEIKNPPKQLYIEGDEKLLNNKSIAIVGSRNCTNYGIKYAEEFAKELSKNNITIVSGLAIGIDTVAHEFSKDYKGRTIAVLGSGLDIIYPKENKELYKKILENGGCIISEYEKGTKVDSKNFPKRNRIVSGISLGILVIEAAYKSGSSIRSEVGLYKTNDDYGDVYYYRGDVQNNNVYFGGYYWKIIRTNGNGSIRLIYSGDKKNADGIDLSINNTQYIYNSKVYGPWFAGYMYGENEKEETSKEILFVNWSNSYQYIFAKSYTYDEATKMYKIGDDYKKGTLKEMQNYLKDYPWTCKSSNTCQVIFKVNEYVSETSLKLQMITHVPSSLDKAFSNEIESDVKKTIDKWYEDNFINKTDNDNSLITDYIADGTFCNDRSITHSIYNSGYKIDEMTYFAPINRMQAYIATLKCPNKRDMFSVTSDYGNAKLTYPVAFITSDEVTLAGGKFKTKNAYFYLSMSSLKTKTMSPSYYNSADGIANTVGLSTNGMLTQYDYLSIGSVIRPVLNIRSDVLISSGDGTLDNPYHLKLK